MRSHFFLCADKAKVVPNRWNQTFAYVISEVKLVGKRKAIGRYKPWKRGSFEKNNVEAFEGERRGSIAPAGATAHHKDLCVLWRVKGRHDDRVCAIGVGRALK